MNNEQESNVPALPKSIFDRAIALGVTQIDLDFRGGSDEGYLDVCVYTEATDGSNAGAPECVAKLYKLEKDIENWAWDVFDYSGAGDGNDYGDSISYDLVNKEVSTSGWYMAHTDCESEFVGGALEIDETTETKEQA
jgi:hypothetical protein